MGKKLRRLQIAGLLLLLAVAPCHGENALRVDVQAEHVDVSADEVALVEILDALTKATGMEVRRMVPVEDFVSCEITEKSLSRTIERLLNGWNYVLVSGKSGSVIKKIWITGKRNSGKRDEGELNAGPASNQEQSPRQAKAQVFMSAASLVRQIEAVPDTEGRGIIITKVLPGGLLQGIGLAEGDLVSRVNADAVTTVEEFAKAVSGVATEEGQEGMRVLRIERQSQEGILDAIYLEVW